MKGGIYLLVVTYLSLSFCSSSVNNISTEKKPKVDSILRIEMFLNAFGVESDGFPYISATLDFKSTSGICKVSYDDPKFKDSTYSLTSVEMQNIVDLFQTSNLNQLRKEYKIGATDQPTSTTKIYTSKEQFQIEDYGLEAPYPMDKLYEIVYKLKYTRR